MLLISISFYARSAQFIVVAAVFWRLVNKGIFYVMLQIPAFETSLKSLLLLSCDQGFRSDFFLTEGDLESIWKVSEM